MSSTNLATIIVLAIAAITVFVVMRIKLADISKIKKLYSSRTQQILVIINEKSIKKFSKLSADTIESILSISDEEWEEWDSLLATAKTISNKYKKTFDDYIQEHFKHVSKRKCCSARLFSSVSSKRNEIINSMTLDELRAVCAETESNWSKRLQITNKANEITQANPEGYKKYISTSKSKKPSNSEIVRDKKIIEQLQFYYTEHKRYLDWTNRQNTFNEEYRNLCEKHRKSDGKYHYEFEYEQIDEDGSFKQQKIKVWQGFCGSFIQYQQSQVKPHLIRKLNNLPEFKNSTRYYNDSVYNGIFNIITELNKDNHNLVVFVTKSNYGWSKTAYNYHYLRLKRLLSDNDIEFCNFEQIKTLYNVEAKFNNILVIDLISSNEELQRNCSLISNFFSSCLPCIGYYSFLKEYDFSEIKNVKQNDRNILTKDIYDNNIDFIKSLFKQVKLHTEFSLFVITNTIIGNALHAEETKARWLDYYDEYDVKAELIDGFIRVRYKTSADEDYKCFTTIGDIKNLNDVARFTYELLMILNIYDQFVEFGQNAIDYINERNLLAHH